MKRGDSASRTVCGRATNGASLDRVRGEYLEMPGLSLTERQAQRLWGLDHEACKTLLEALVRAGFLRRTQHGGYVRADVA
jgi:hypothetical protein